MLGWIRRHGQTVVVAGISALVVSGAPDLGHVTKKLGHIVKHLNPLFVNVGEKASDADLLDGNDSTAFLSAGEKAADSDLLDGMDSSAFLGATDKAADSELLDGLNSTAFQRSFNRIVVVRTAAELLSAVDTATFGTLIKLEPGTYNIGSNVLDVPSGVDLEGSGELRTGIISGGSAAETDATVSPKGTSSSGSFRSPTRGDSHIPRRSGPTALLASPTSAQAPKTAAPGQSRSTVSLGPARRDSNSGT